MQSTADSSVRAVHERDTGQSVVKKWEALRRHQEVATLVKPSCSGHLSVQVPSYVRLTLVSRGGKAVLCCLARGAVAVTPARHGRPYGGDP